MAELRGLELRLRVSAALNSACTGALLAPFQSPRRPEQGKSSPKGAAFLVAARALRKAQVASKAAKDQPMDRALKAALAALSAHAVEAGMRMPQPRISKPAAGGRRKKTTTA